MSSETITLDSVTVKPRLRGVFHQYAFFVAPLAGLVLALSAYHSGRALWVALVYSVGMVALFGTSALYHRVDWNPARRLWMKRLDHSMIFLFVAGSYTPFAMLVLPPRMGSWVMLLAWTTAALGVTLRLFVPRSPKWITALLYLAFGWAGVLILPEIGHQLGWQAAGLVLLGGLFYSVGGVMYALHRPNPIPTVLGYHEMFHIMTLFAAAAHFAVMYYFVF